MPIFFAHEFDFGEGVFDFLDGRKNCCSVCDIINAAQYGIFVRKFACKKLLCADFKYALFDFSASNQRRVRPFGREYHELSGLKSDGARA